MIYSLEVMTSWQVTLRTWLTLTANLICCAMGAYRPSLSYYTGTSRARSDTRPTPNGRHAAGRSEETSWFDDSLCHLCDSMSFNSQLQAMHC